MASITSSTVLSTAAKIITSLLTSGTSSKGWQGEVEDFNRLRQTSRKLMRTSFQPAWLFRLVVPGAPTDFDLYVKDITFPYFDINVDEEMVGASAITWPTGEQAHRISMTVRDNVDQRVATFLRTWAHQVVKTDGTVGLPYGTNGYVRNVSIYMQSRNGTERLVCTREMYPVQCGEVSMSRDNTGEHLEIPVTFAQFTNLATTSKSASTSSSSSTSTKTSSTSTSTSSTSTTAKSTSSNAASSKT